MQLITFTLQGYRRFVTPASVKLQSDLVAFVGPNEAGKSSILKALTHLNSDGAFTNSELPRRSKATPLLKWQLQLDDEDREALRELGGDDVQKLAIVKGDDGIRRWSFQPDIVRDRNPRAAALEAAQSAAKSLSNMENEYGTHFDMSALLELLGSIEDYTPSEFIDLQAFIDDLTQILEQVPGREIDQATDTETRALIQELSELSVDEQQTHPRDLARAILEPRVPEIRLFDVEDRNLLKEYDLNEDADNPPPALRHLAELGDLDLVALRDEIVGGAIADAATRKNAANKVLLGVFQSWKQESIALQVEFQGSLLHVQVTTPADNGLSSIDDRSDGMRWFATLLAFTRGAGDRPILLADEIETHLHYDAQADLVEVLSQQNLTSKVIYTTHSFGCLPNDLGNGVRVVEQVDAGTSTIKNGFWENGSGFSPLLVSMGAAAVTFTPTRKAVIGEGATEAIVLPTVLRQAAQLSKLEFQVAPGLSSVAAADVPELASEAGFVAYLVDGDDGGLKIAAKLGHSVTPGKVVILKDPTSGEPMETEDLIDPVIYAHAVNKELGLWNSLKSEIQVQDIPSTMRTKAVEAWCKKRRVSPPDKAAVAQRIANCSSDGDVFAAERRDFIVDLLERLKIALHHGEADAAVPNPAS